MRLRLAAISLFFLIVILGALGAARSAFFAQREPAATRTPVHQNAVAFRVTFGYLRLKPETYDGSVSVTGGRLLQIDPWRFFGNDTVTGGSSWKLEIKRTVFENEPDWPTRISSGSVAGQNLVPAGLIVRVDPTTTSVRFETRQGNFTVPVRDIVYGNVLRYLGGDVLVERVPDSFQISNNAAEQHDYPSIAVTKAGVVWTSWQAYRDRGDNVYVRQGGEPPVKLTTAKGDIYRTSVAEDRSGRIHVVWSERTGLDWNLYERVYDGSSWSPRRQITDSGTSPNIFHKLIPGRTGPLRLIWVGYEGGQSYLYASSLEGSNWSKPERVGGPSVWSPDGATDSEGNFYVAWDSYINGNYDIYFRRIPASGTPDPVEQVTHSLRFQAHPSLAVDGQGRPWLAWDESGVNWGKDWTHDDPYRSTTLYHDRSARVAVKDGGTWKQAGDFSTAVDERLRRYWELPHLAVDGNGRVWAMFQIRTAARNNREDGWCAGGLWDLFLTSYENGVWRPAAYIPSSTARPEVPYQIVGVRDGVWMTWATDGRTFRPGGGFGGKTMVHYDVFNAKATADAPAGQAVLTTFSDPVGHAQVVHPNEKQDIARIREYRTSVNGANYRILRGDFHRHSEISSDGSGDGSVEDYYRYNLDVAEMDTGILTDHNMGGDVEYSWWRTEKSYDLFHIRDRYTPLFGYERSVSYPNGHRNVVFDHRGVRTLPVGRAENRGQVNSGSILYPYLRQNRGICMEHSLATGQGTDYRDNDPNLEPLVEIYQGYHASYEYKGAPRAEDDSNHLLIHGSYEPAGFWWNALAKGLKLGVEASSDHISTHVSYTLIYTPDTDRSHIVQSMRVRHAYAATDNIVLDFEANEPDGRQHLMGEAFSMSGSPKLRAKILGTDRIMQIDLIRNNQFLYTQRPEGKDFEFEYIDKSPKTGENYYYIRVMQQDHNLAWSSPIWIDKQ